MEISNGRMGNNNGNNDFRFLMNYFLCLESKIYIFS